MGGGCRLRLKSDGRGKIHSNTERDNVTGVLAWPEICKPDLESLFFPPFLVFAALHDKFCLRPDTIVFGKSDNSARWHLREDPQTQGSAAALIAMEGQIVW